MWVVSSQKTVLRKCAVESLTVRKTSDYGEAQIIDLRGGTTVSGTITFESGIGEVWVSSDSELSSTQVHGAQIHKK
jgi:hypothetical protein